jgi:hypothetical protein
MRLFLPLLAATTFFLVNAATVVAQDAAPANSRKAEVEQLVDRYFRSWSAQDMERYGQCFMPQAAIQLINEDGQLITMALGPFLRSQQEAHRRSANRMVETPETIEIRFDGKLAHALVYWKLVDGARAEFGYDHFTLMQFEGKWRIVNLVFYTTPDRGESENPNRAPAESQGRNPLENEGPRADAPAVRN